MHLTSTSRQWTAPDGQVFSFSQWNTSQSPPRALVVAVHGLSGAALDFEPLGRHLVAHGLTTLAVELRGQGNDPVTDRRGDLADIQDWFADLKSFLARVRGEHPKVPLFLYGESMGGALLTRFLAQASPEDQPAGLILASPVVVLPRRATSFQLFLFTFFHWLRPKFRINVRKFAKPGKNEPPPYVTRDEAHRKWFETAPHRLDRYTIRFFRCLYQLIEGCFAAAPKLRLPTLIIYAAHDIFIAPARVEEFFALLGSEDKQLRLFPAAYHLLLHDHDRELALAQVEAWLLQHLPPV